MWVGHPAVHCRISTWMGDRLRVGKLSRYVTGYLSQFSSPSFRYLWWAPYNYLISVTVCFRLSRSSNRKRVYDFLLVRHSNLGPILHCFGDIAGFSCSWPHPYSTLILGAFLLHQIAHVGISPSRGLKLFGREVIFEVFQPAWKTYLNVTDKQTTYCGITTLCVASYGKNWSYLIMHRTMGLYWMSGCWIIKLKCYLTNRLGLGLGVQ